MTDGETGDKGDKGEVGTPGQRGTAFGTTSSSASDYAFYAATGFAAQDGDQLLVSNAYGSTIYRRNGGYWYNSTALTISGDAIISGTLAVSRLAKTSGDFDGTTFQLGSGTYVAGYGAGVAFKSSSGTKFAAIAVNSAATALGVGTVGAHSAANFVNSSDSSYSFQYTGASLAKRDAGGVFTHYTTGNSATLASATHAAYLTGPAGPFTGAHDGLLRRDLHFYPDIGDILVDTELFIVKGIGDAIFENEPSWMANQKAAIGVFAGYAEADHIPSSLTDTSGLPLWNISICRQRYRFVVINAIGEGLINVCGEGGDIDAGDLIATSSIPGKGMKQADDIVRSITVAKAREAVTFASPTEVKQIACIYLCG